jgi:peptidyl-prolyl cis-trans isomerase SurA
MDSAVNFPVMAQLAFMARVSKAHFRFDRRGVKPLYRTTRTIMTIARLSAFSNLLRSIPARTMTATALAALVAGSVTAQTVTDTAMPEAGLSIPADAQILGNANSNVYRPSATVNGEIITATDVEQRIALVRIANNGQLPDEEIQRVRLQVFSQLIDETLQIQEAKASKIEIEASDIDREFARIAGQLRQTPEQFTQFLASSGASARAMKRQIEADQAWQSLLARNIDPFTNVSTEEVSSMRERMEAQRGTQEYRIGEIYLAATPETIQAVAENARRILQALGDGSGNFQDLARRYSNASTASVGGDLGWIRLSQLPTSLAESAQSMQPGQLAGPIEVPGGVSILYLIDQRSVLTADPRDAVLSLKQISLAFAPGTTPTQATELAASFTTRTRSIAGCGQAEEVAATLGADVLSRDQISMRDLPPPLQALLADLQVGQVTPPFGSREQGVSVLVLCGRDLPEQAALPSTEDIAERLRQDRVNRRAQRYLRDLRRDAVIDYN